MQIADFKSKQGWWFSTSPVLCYHALPQTHDFTEKMIPYNAIKKQVFSLPLSTIKMKINRIRLCFNRTQIAFYCIQIVEHQDQQKTFKTLFTRLSRRRRGKLQVPNYSTFMHNINVFSPLVELLLVRSNRTSNITPSTLWNAVNTTLIPEKEMVNITDLDWKNNRGTTRIKNKTKVRI